MVMGIRIIIMDLARALPKLEILELGGAPCRTRGGVTIKGLIAFARGCPHLFKLCIHFQITSFVKAVTGIEIPAPSDDEMVVRRQDCAPTDLEVGETHIQEDTVNIVTMTLLQFFPRLLDIKFIENKWEGAMEIIRFIRRASAFVQYTGKGYLVYPSSSSVTFCQATHSISGIRRNRIFHRF